MSANFCGKRLREFRLTRRIGFPKLPNTIVEIDNAIKWGFGWEIGVFEAWDAIGVAESVERMKAEGMKVPANVQAMLDSGATSFYKYENGTTSFLRFGQRRLQRNCLINKALSFSNRSKTERALSNRIKAQV